MKKTLFIILDGLGDLPCEELGDKTPLEAAKTPNLDKLAERGQVGLIDVMHGKRPDSDTAHLILFGYDLNKYYLGRGPYEAAGLNMEMKEGDVVLRANLATVDENDIIIDRRAGRIKDAKPFEKMLNINVDDVGFIVKAGTGHRLALIMRGKDLSPNITKTDPKKIGTKPLKAMPKDNSDESKRTAEILNKYISITHEILDKCEENKKRKEQGELPANMLLTRGAGQYRKIPSFEEKYGMKAACIAGAGLYKGIGRILGMDVIEVDGATGFPDTNVFAKFNRAIQLLKDYDFVFVHVKATDIFGEDGDCVGKKEFIEKVDKAAKILLDLSCMIVITGDHSTPCKLKDHSGDPVPLLLVGMGKDDVNEFNERACRNGSLGTIEGRDLMKIVLRD